MSFDTSIIGARAQNYNGKSEKNEFEPRHGGLPDCPPISLPLFQNIPAELQNLKQWVTWEYRYRPQQKKPWTKSPTQAANPRFDAKANDANTWGDFGTASQAAKRLNPKVGIGFVFKSDDPYCGVDIDDCRNPDTGQLNELAREVLRRFRSYAEVSPSRTGLKIFVRGKPKFDSDTKTGRKNEKLGVEVYRHGRYFTMTGDVIGDRHTIVDDQEALDWLIGLAFPPKPKAEPKSSNGKTAKQQNNVTPSQSGKYVPDDEQIIAYMTSMPSNCDKISRLWHGSTNDYKSPSQADLALCNHIAFYVGNDPGRIERIFRQSKLANRDKWQERTDYPQLTIGEAVAGLNKKFDWESYYKHLGLADSESKSVSAQQGTDAEKLAFLREKLKLPDLTGVIKRGKKDAEYELLVDGRDPIVIGKIAKVMSVAAVRERLLDDCGHLIPMDKRGWPQVALTIRTLAVDVDLGDDDLGRVLDWLDLLLRSNPADWGACTEYRDHEPYSKAWEYHVAHELQKRQGHNWYVTQEGRLRLTERGLRDSISRYNPLDQVSRKELCPILSRVGFSQLTLDATKQPTNNENTKKRIQVRMWESPEGFADRYLSDVRDRYK